MKRWIVTLTDVDGSRQYLGAVGAFGLSWSERRDIAFVFDDVERAGVTAGRMRRLNRRAVDRGALILVEEVKPQ